MPYHCATFSGPLLRQLIAAACLSLLASPAARAQQPPTPCPNQASPLAIAARTGTWDIRGRRQVQGDYFVIEWNESTRQAFWYDYRDHFRTTNFINRNATLLPVVDTKEKIAVHVCGLHFGDQLTVTTNPLAVPEGGADIRGATAPATATSLAAALDTLSTQSTTGAASPGGSLGFGATPTLTPAPINGIAPGTITTRDSGGTATYKDASITLSGEQAALLMYETWMNAQALMLSIADFKQNDLPGGIGAIRREIDRDARWIDDHRSKDENDFAAFDEDVNSAQLLASDLSNLSAAIAAQGFGARAVAIHNNFATLRGILDLSGYSDDGGTLLSDGTQSWTNPDRAMPGCAVKHKDPHDATKAQTATNAARSAQTQADIANRAAQAYEGTATAVEAAARTFSNADIPPIRAEAQQLSLAAKDALDAANRTVSLAQLSQDAKLTTAAAIASQAAQAATEYSAKAKTAQTSAREAYDNAIKIAQAAAKIAQAAAGVPGAPTFLLKATILLKATMDAQQAAEAAYAYATKSARQAQAVVNAANAARAAALAELTAAPPAQKTKQPPKPALNGTQPPTATSTQTTSANNSAPASATATATATATAPPSSSGSSDAKPQTPSYHPIPVNTASCDPAEHNLYVNFNTAYHTELAWLFTQRLTNPKDMPLNQFIPPNATVPGLVAQVDAWDPSETFAAIYGLQATLKQIDDDAGKRVFFALNDWYLASHVEQTDLLTPATGNALMRVSVIVQRGYVPFTLASGPTPVAAGAAASSSAAGASGGAGGSGGSGGAGGGGSSGSSGASGTAGGASSAQSASATTSTPAHAVKTFLIEVHRVANFNLAGGVAAIKVPTTAYTLLPGAITALASVCSGAASSTCVPPSVPLPPAMPVTCNPAVANNCQAPWYGICGGGTTYTVIPGATSNSTPPAYYCINQSQSSNWQVAALVGLTWYPFGHDYFPRNKGFYGRNLLPSLLVATSVNTLGRIDI